MGLSLNVASEDKMSWPTTELQTLWQELRSDLLPYLDKQTEGQLATMAKNRSLWVINEDFEPFFNKILSSVVV